MKIKPVEEPWMDAENTFKLTETDDTRHTAEWMRLLASRDAVLREVAPWELGGSQW